jgi:hypothetical protein
MPIELEVTDINVVEEEIRGAYVETDGKYRLDPDKYHELKAAPLAAKNKQLLDEKKKLAESAKVLEKQRGHVETDLDKVIADKEKRITELETSVREYSIWTPVQELAVKNGVLPDRLQAVMTLLRSQSRFDKDEQGNLIFKDVDGYATGIKPARAFEYQLKQEFPWAFEASKAGGSGSQNGTKGGKKTEISRETFDAMSVAEKHQAMKDGTIVY